MILGEDKRECMSCREMKPYDDFDYDGDDDNHLNDDCKECYIINKAKSLNEPPIYLYGSGHIKENKETHAPSCPICDSKTGCGCYDTDDDGYR